MVRAVPALLDELQVAISKQAKISTGGKAGKGTAREKSPINFGALAVRDALLVEMALWGTTEIDEIRKHPKAAEIVSGMGKAVKNAYRCIDRLQDRKYLGQCGATEDGAVCHAELWVKPGQHQIKCTQCETVHDVGDRRSDMLEQAKDMLFSVKESSQMMGEVAGIRVTEASIRGYLH